MYRSEIYVLYKRTVRQVGHLPEVISRCTVSKIKKCGKFSISELNVIKASLSQKEITFTDVNEKIVKG